MSLEGQDAAVRGWARARFARTSPCRYFVLQRSAAALFESMCAAAPGSSEVDAGTAEVLHCRLNRDIVDLGDRHFEVIHTPGHSPGGIAL